MVRTCRRFPQNWQNVIPISGEVVENTRFIIFKTPVDAECGLRVRKEKQFTTRDLLFQFVQRGQELGLIINLSFSTRYYDPAVFDCITEHKHIPCPPAGYTRREDIVKKFLSTVDTFLNNHKDDNLLIGIHCSDGINRSGYLVCRYLIDRLHMGSDAALDAFEKARGHTIERGSCIQALHRAVAERRNKEPSPIENLGSDGERKSRKRKAPELSQADEMLQQLAMLEQHFSQPTEEDSPIGSWPEDRKPVPVSIGPQAMPKKKKEEFEDGEFMEGDEYFEEDDDVFEDGGEPSDLSTSQRRRVRRKRLTKKFNIMKSGKFHLIQEVLREE
uniref:Tyrosine specific protein phosphatases domain-containing protein n=1 Tax=Panagrolaimus sp. PS1159 TaxID=55785 RepID=A0AC35FDR6_9BILA